jgi:NAD-dependent SIR2 family protein deacetylase
MPKQPLSNEQAKLQQAAEAIATADAIVVAAGAGMGVDSGMPDFRGTTGFWRAYPALAKAGLRFEEVASPHTFDSDPALAWGFYGHRLMLYRRTLPHAGFGLLLKWMGRAPKPGAVFTSNVDGHFQAAGFDPLQVHECHGSIHHLQCTECDAQPWSANNLFPAIDEDACRWLGPLPHCPACGALARPNLLMFWDGDWASQRYDEQGVCVDQLINEMRRPVCIEIGAGTAIPSVRSFSQRVVTQHGGALVRINVREHETDATIGLGLAMGALDALRGIDELL